MTEFEYGDFVFKIESDDSGADSEDMGEIVISVTRKETAANFPIVYFQKKELAYGDIKPTICIPI